MKRNYPPNFQYQDFAPQWKAEFFDPDAWADLVKESGAKWVGIDISNYRLDRKICEKRRQMQSIYFFVSNYQNPYRELVKFKKFSKLYQLWWPVTWPIFKEWYKRNPRFSKFFWEYFSEFLILFHEIIFGNKVLSSTCNKHCDGNMAQKRVASS